MSAVVETKPSKAMFWASWVLSIIPIMMLGSGAIFGLLQMPFVVEGMVKYGFTPGLVRYVALAEGLCAILYAIPATAPVGAMLMTAYFGGAVVTHMRAGESQWFVPVIFGVLVWAGLLMRRVDLRHAVLGI
jgi:hypothetical protein